MDLTHSFETVIPARVRNRYELREIRNAAAILAATNALAFAEVLEVLSAFELQPADITEAGGNKSTVARRLDDQFRKLGWREGRHDLTVKSVLKVMPYRGAEESEPQVVETEVLSEGYKVDNVKGRIALDVEWNAKDGNLDRDVAAYRALYDSGIIDGGVIITRSFGPIRDLSRRLGRAGGFDTATTTTLEKLEPRLTRGDAGGCPLLAVAITDRCFVES
jgi:hypothetical protein